MTIKQQGGIFGRNPSFNDLEVTNNLDASATSNNAASFERLSTDGEVVNYVKDGTTVGTMATKFGRAVFAGNGCGLSPADGAPVIYPVYGRGALLGSTWGGSIDLGTSSTRFANIYLSGNVNVSAGSGIDFSATSGTGTSELFDDYEDGTWTPVFTASTTDPTFASYPVRSAHYRKIGAMVFVTARFRTSGYNSDGVGNLRISGLPYAAKSSGSFFDTGGIIIHSVQNWGSIPSNGVVKPGDAFISLIGSTGFVDQSVLALGTGTNNNDISFSGMYVTD